MKIIVPWLLAAASGLALALALPGPGLALLAFVFPILLLEALERVEGRWRPWFLGWLAGTVHWAVTTNWVVSVMHHYGGLPEPVAVACLVGMGAYLGLLWACAAAVSAAVPSHRRIWLFPAVWIAVAVLQRFQPYGFTWSGIASAFVDWPWLMASVSVWGASGLGWCVAASGSALWGLARRETRKSAAVLLATSGITLVFAMASAPMPEVVGEPVTIAVIQPGTSLEEKWDPSQSAEIAERVWAMTAEAAYKGADVVLWPESAVAYNLESDAGYREIVEEMALEFDVEIVLNSIGRTGDGGYANSAYLITPTGVSPSRYDKVHLVPFGEFVPGWARVAFTESLVREVGGFTPGGKPILLPAVAPLGMAICFEVVFPDHIARQVRAGAQILVTLTNDGWYGFSWAPSQHFAQVRVRAAESRRWFARAALTGISAFVAPTGRVMARLDVGESGILIHDVQPLEGLTPRTRFGDWWAALCAVITAVLLVAPRLRRRK